MIQSAKIDIQCPSIGILMKNMLLSLSIMGKDTL